ncbi:Helicase C-terminal [Penicillium robsamsonii]|uniref:Helicase C-terminal n=1 Tax=Penicillium robsamsonii TaxID=1792511 RepID=UPI002549234B|nr:Helicase C-terminal [Penicillium robsamsonii]KAJ5807438.1 Helicase C-terminal [Penicillium robsamsonii]
MDQSIGTNTNPIKEASKKTSSPAKEDPTRDHTDDVQIETGPEDLYNLTSPADVEVCILPYTPNVETSMVQDNSTEPGSQDDSAPDSVKEAEEYPRDRDSTGGSSRESSSIELGQYDAEGHPQDDSKNEEPSDSDYSDNELTQYDLDEEPDDDTDEERSCGSDDEYQPTEGAPKPAKGGAKIARPKGKKQNAKAPATLKETVKSLMTRNILSAANENATRFHQGIPVSQKKDKAKALMEEVAKLPAEDQPQAKKDASALLEASRKFTRSASIENMDWKIKGLRTLLKHHQLKAAAWMRTREESEVEPNGGLLCDEMGLGKTLTALAIIAHENFQSSRKYSTLIIVPRSLIAQWIDQIDTHCEDKIRQSVFEYYAGARTDDRNVVSTMQKKIIVLTTYEQVCSSYPKLKPPVTIKSPEEFEAWREEEFARRAGPFHKIEWHRIILDEAHLIKNKDCATSISVRALEGRFKWAMSGTPLHNGVEELYPYLHFIFTSERMEYETFLKKHSNGLDELLETVLHRSTYSTRILGKPIVTLPGINNRVVEVELCAAEKLLYREIQDLGVAMLSGLAGTKQKQSKCILAVITMLRMFVSHPLLAQKFLEAALNKRVIEELKAMAQQEDLAETPSEMIISLILSIGAKVALRPRPPGDFDELRKIYYDHMAYIHQHQGRYQELMLKVCPRCDNIVKEENEFVITSCQHIYCKGCFDELPDQNGDTNTITRVCSSCKISIDEAGYSHDSPKGSPKKSSPRKRKQSKSEKTAKKVSKPRGSFKEQVLLRDLSDEWDEPSDNEADWVSCIGDRMPSAKTTAVRDLVANWVKEDKDVKIVVFVQFLKTAKILQFMCDQEEWEYALITGKVSPTSRDKKIEKFAKEKNVKIMITSLKTGGVGLNLTMANKCILVDPWWNEAIQDQAYCRLYRIGQPRAVEYVQIVAKGSIDTWMIKLQKAKTWNIRQIFSTDSLKEILGLSGEIHEEPDGGFLVFAAKENKHLHTWTQAIDGIIEEVESAEED